MFLLCVFFAITLYRETRAFGSFNLHQLFRRGPKKYEIHRNDVVINENVKEKISNIPLRIGTVNKGGQGERIYSPLGTAITLSAYGGGAGAKTGLYRVNGKIRKLAPRECARLDGFPETFKIAERDIVAYKQFGNSVVVDVLQKIMKNALEKKEVVACL